MRSQSLILRYRGTEDSRILEIEVRNNIVYCYLYDKDRNRLKDTRIIRRCRSNSYENTPLANSTYNARLLWMIHHARNYFITNGLGNAKLIYKNNKLLEELFSKWIADTFKVDKC